jgi:O-acetyl-ADP-ribose deacetylase (regulator of RNase III)
MKNTPSLSREKFDAMLGGKTRIIPVSGDLLDFPNGIECIMHGCNTLNIMGAGIAKSISLRFPYAFYADKTAHRRAKIANKSLLGTFSHVSLPGDKHIINLYQQSEIAENPLDSAPFRIMAFEAALIRALKFCKEIGVANVGLPHKIGCGLAGGNWNEVRNVISNVSETIHGLTIFIVKLPTYTEHAK